MQIKTRVGRLRVARVAYPKQGRHGTHGRGPGCRLCPLCPSFARASFQPEALVMNCQP